MSLANFNKILMSLVNPNTVLPLLSYFLLDVTMCNLPVGTHWADPAKLQVLVLVLPTLPQHQCLTQHRSLSNRPPIPYFIQYSTTITKTPIDNTNVNTKFNEHDPIFFTLFYLIPSHCFILIRLWQTLLINVRLSFIERNCDVKNTCKGILIWEKCQILFLFCVTTTKLRNYFTQTMGNLATALVLTQITYTWHNTGTHPGNSKIISLPLLYA